MKAVRDRIIILEEEVPILQAMAASVPPNGTIVEIGSAWGYSTSKLASASGPTVKIIAIDPWTLGGQKQQPVREMKFDTMASKFKGKIEKIKSFSEDIEVEIIGEIDLLFIDGNHNFEFVANDYQKFSPFIKQNGWLVFHDYHVKRVPGVTKVIDEIVIPSKLWDWHILFSLWIGKKI